MAAPIPAIASLLLLGSISMYSLVMQTLPTTGIPSELQQITLNVACIVAVGVLWRSLQKKDEALSAMTAKVTDALAVNSDTQKELRKIVEASTEAKRELTIAIDKLGASMGTLPCAGIAAHLAVKNQL